MTQPTASVIVLNWNGKRFLKTCLDALRIQTFREFEVLLVDNGSTDGSVDYIRKEFADWLGRSDMPRLRLISLPENTGFSGGNAAGLETADPASKYIVTLNNDTEAALDWLHKLVEGIEKAGPSFGAICGPMLFSSEQATIASAGIEMQKNGLAIDRLLGAKWDRTAPPEEIFGPSAGAALYRRSALETCGFFDTEFFAYLEDADLAWRLRLTGWRTLYLPGAAVWHDYSGTGGQGSAFKNFQLGRNRFWVILKNWPLGLLRRYWWQILKYDLAACAYTLYTRNYEATKGRLTALKKNHLQRLKTQRRSIQRSRVTPIRDLDKWLAEPTSLREMLNLKKTTDHLAAAAVPAQK